MGRKNLKCPVGIDLGTTYSRVAVWREQDLRVEMLTNQYNNRKTRSIVAFTDKDVLIGEDAQQQANTNAENTIFDAKRLIGRKYGDPIIEKDFGTWPFKVAGDSNDEPQFVVKQGEYKLELFSAEKISSIFLKHICQFGKRHVKEAVITVPARFNESQRQATKNACKNAGLEILKMIDEPVAAAIAYGLENRANYSVKERNIFVFDLGGGNLNVSLLTVKDNFFKVIATGGNNHLGGEDFNNNMVSHFMKLFNMKKKMDLRKDPRALSRLRSACESAKRKLSVDNSAVVQVDALFQGMDFSESITRAKFEELNSELFKECMTIAKRCLADAKMDKSHVHDVVLVGGSSRIPKVQELLLELFPDKKIHNNIHHEEAVAQGAACLAALLNDSIMNVPNLVLSDINPLSLGVDLSGDVMSVIIPRNAVIPVTQTAKFTTSDDDQTSMYFDVYEGERLKASKNNLLGSLELYGFPKAPRGYDVYIIFSIDRNGTLSASLEDRKTNKECKLKITKDNGRLSTNEIAQVIREAKIHEAEDAAHVKKANARSDLRRYVYQMEKAFKDKDINSKLTTEDKDKIKCASDIARKLINADLDKQDMQVYGDCLKEAKSIFEPIKRKIG